MKKLEVNQELLQKVVKTGTAFVLAGTLLMGSNVVLPLNYNSSVVASALEENMVNLNVQMGVNLYMNDKGFIPRDVNGNETYPFIVDGTTYVPIRAIAELFNASVNWDEKTNTVTIATTGEGAKLEHTPREKQELYNMNIIANKGAKLVVNGTECIPTDVNGNIKDIYVVNGTTYVPVRAVSTALGLPITWSDKTNSVFIGKHKTEGLTVENINDPEFFDKCGRDFFDFQGAIDISYTLNNNGQVTQYNLGAERNNGGFYPPEVMLILMNYEYCSEDLIKSVLKDVSIMDLYRVCNGANFFAVAIATINAGYTFKFQDYIIDDNYSQGLQKAQELCFEAYYNESYAKLFEFLDNYFEGETGDFLYTNTNPGIKFFMATILRKMHKERLAAIHDRAKVYDDDYTLEQYYTCQNLAIDVVDQISNLIIKDKNLVK